MLSSLILFILAVASDGSSPVHAATSDAAISDPCAGPWAAELDADAMRMVLSCAGWPEELHGQALRVTWCESRWSPGAHRDGSSVWGLFQLWQDDRWGWFTTMGKDPSSWDNPVANARTALLLFERSGWGPWECRP